MGCGWLTPTDALATIQRHLPTGPAWDAYRTPGKKLYRLIAALANAYNDASAALCRLVAELDPRSTEQMLGEWEAAVSLPDACLPTARTIAERRSWVMWRLTKKRWNTRQDWIDLAALFGLQVRITPGWLVQRPALFSAIFPVPLYNFPKLGRFRVYIDVLDQRWPGFPYDGTKAGSDKFPIPFTNTNPYISQYRCLIERVAPANVLIIWNEFPAIPPRGNGVTFSDDFSEDFA